MSDERTPEQKAADEAVRAALEQHEAAYRPDHTGMTSSVLVDFVTIAAMRGFMDDGSDGSRIVIGTPNSGDSPAYMLVGLLELAKAEITEGFLYQDRED